MIVAYCSDLHLEFSDLDLDIFTPADILILAGDIVTIKRMIREFTDVKYDGSQYLVDLFDTITGRYSHIVYVVGNHEYYGLDISAVYTLKHLLAAYTNLHILIDQSIELEVDGVVDGKSSIKIFGGTGWTDINNGDPLSILEGSSYMNDFRYISVEDRKFNDRDWIKYHNTFLQKLTEEIDTCDIIVSHHAPSYKVILPRYQHMTETNHMYCSSLEHLITDNVKYWIHGHLHGSLEYRVNNCLITSNTRGYPGEFPIYDTFQLETFEI